MAEQEDTSSPPSSHHPRTPSTFSLPLRPRVMNRDKDDDEQEAMASGAQTMSPTNLPSSPGISVEFHGDPDQRFTLHGPVHSAPANMQPFKSPLRHHKRTPSAHHEVKETLNARSEYMEDDSDGRSHHAINQYVIKEEIGHGSYGAVHLATDQYGQEYAVKEFSKSRLRKRAQSNTLRRGPGPLGRHPHRAGFGAPDVASPRLSDHKAKEASDALFLIREEIAIMKKLHHQNLVQLIEVLDDPEEDSLYMVLEMCKKGVIMKVGLGEPADPYPEENCRCWFRDLILGIEYLHSQGVVHRDIKPDNLLLTNDDVLKIVDFGVSEMFEKAGNMRTAKSAGSPAFLPPELCVAKHGDISGKAADIWSMGVSLYCLRYGRIPFERAGVLEIYEAIKSEDPKLPDDEKEESVDLMHRLLEKDPEKRITMAELREHPWVTKGGEDPLLSAEENCSDAVEAPNALELNHAFTRKMSNLVCVIKAIRKFKGLLASNRALSSPRPDDHTTGNSQEATPRAQQQQPESTDDHASRIIKERENFLRTTRRGTSTSTDTVADNVAAAGLHGKGHAHDPTDMGPPLHLGIGTGGNDDEFEFSSGGKKPPAEYVSDSPTAVDFNIYDRAFDDEVERIKRSSSTRKSGSGSSRGGGDAGTLLYLTKLNETSRYKTVPRTGGKDENSRLVWAGGDGGGGGQKEDGATPRTAAGAGAGQRTNLNPTGFAGVVAKAMIKAQDQGTAGAE
ncbi:kinase-like domain-containing protein [Bombardia bombarda]|uniref:Kinase-like domain-containing protein n=1 Tax=Bombardia bombarda TaxID=252184 RepID=A0AA39XB64_9PEZI|nr:kinase-like domain-containing protein [Bombardia bombarda]